MEIKIHFGTKPLILTDRVTPDLEPFRHHDDAVLIDELSSHAVNAMLHEMRVEKVHAGIFLHPDVTELKKAIWKKFIVLKAAGGLVINEKKELLFILRRGLWDLPKGKNDGNEDSKECALREVKEETGFDIEVKKLLGVYSTPNMLVQYPDGSKVQIFGLNFEAEIKSGVFRSNDEVSEMNFFSEEEIIQIPIFEIHKERIYDAFKKKSDVVIK